MDDYVFRRDLVEPELLKDLSRRSDLRGAIQFGSHALAILATTALLHRTWGTWWCLPVGLLHGMLLNFLYAAQHELIHRTAFRTRRVNDMLARLTGFVLIFPSDFDRIRHFQHHRHTQDPERDPQLINAGEITLGTYLTRLAGMRFWLTRVKLVAMSAAGDLPDFYMTAEQKRTITREARVHLALYALIAVVALAYQSWIPVTYWLLPMVLTKWTHQIHNMSEHGGRPLVPDMLTNTRTTLTNGFMRWIVWNMSYHAEHHNFPGVPFHALPALHRIMRGHLKAVSPGYTAVHADLFATFWREWRRAR